LGYISTFIALSFIIATIEPASLSYMPEFAARSICFLAQIMGIVCGVISQPALACTDFRFPCASVGYALETRCHLGKSIIFDTAGKMGWRVSLQKHPIKNLILDVLEETRSGKKTETFRWQSNRVIA
jgi:hypothetical protein